MNGTGLDVSYYWSIQKAVKSGRRQGYIKARRHAMGWRVPTHDLDPETREPFL